jgi:hypothetical protein
MEVSHCPLIPCNWPVRSQSFQDSFAERERALGFREGSGVTSFGTAALLRGQDEP